MTESPDCAAPTLSVQEAFADLSERPYRHHPIVEGAELVGVVSLRSIAALAQIQPVLPPSPIEAPPGLEGVVEAWASLGGARWAGGPYPHPADKPVGMGAQ